MATQARSFGMVHCWSEPICCAVGMEGPGSLPGNSTGQENGSVSIIL
ncbi:hypothetical protein AYX14_07169 [Cryptococcus neoformans]|nr:hypothetical protein AYX14_07169 [Cryptococcus neoformans var. grubii]